MTAIARAGLGDLAALKTLIESAYRGDSARRGWNHEADLLDDERITEDELREALTDPASAMLIARAGGALAGCVLVRRLNDTLAYLGTLCVDPLCQSGGLGRQLLDAAEDHATSLGCTRMEMTVIMCRDELIGWYGRRGYLPTGETRPFPTPGLAIHFLVLEKTW